MVRVKAPRFEDWWHQAPSWVGNPMKHIYEWIEDEAQDAKT
jgi:hypothetical protein